MKVLSPLAVITVALLSQGCVAAAVIGTAAAGIKAATDPRSAGTQVDDSTLELRVNATLSRGARIRKEARINVSAYQSEVLLVDRSPNSELSARVRRIVMGVEGTTEILNEIRQGQPIGLDDAPNDIWITTKVRSQLFTSDQMEPFDVKVMTENGEVFLLGLMTEHETKAAMNITSRASSMKRVTTASTFTK